MSGVCGVGGSDKRFSASEEEAMRQDQSSSAILNEVRKDSGHQGPDVSVRGDDKPWHEVKDEQHKHWGIGGVAEIAHGSVEGLHACEIHAIEAATAQGVGATIAGWGVALGAPLAFGLGVHELVVAHEHAEEQKAAITRDDLHAAMLTQLDLPAAFKQDELQKWSAASKSSSGLPMKMATPFATKGKSLVAVLQLHADRGVNAAMDMGSMSKEAFFAANPKIKAAYDADPAFRAGFDAMEWANKPGNEAAKAKLQQDVCDRDARYAQAHVTYRI